MSTIQTSVCTDARHIQTRMMKKRLRKSYLSICSFLFIYLILLMSDICMGIDFQMNSYSILDFLRFFFLTSFEFYRTFVELLVQHLFRSNGIRSNENIWKKNLWRMLLQQHWRWTQVLYSRIFRTNNLCAWTVIIPMYGMHFSIVRKAELCVITVMFRLWVIWFNAIICYSIRFNWYVLICWHVDLSLEKHFEAHLLLCKRAYRWTVKNVLHINGKTISYSLHHNA